MLAWLMARWIHRPLSHPWHPLLVGVERAIFTRASLTFLKL